MSYVVLEDFSDMNDNSHFYRAGDRFPRTGMVVSSSRIAELSSAKNRLGRPVIKETGGGSSVARVEKPKPTESLVEPVKRSRKKRKE